jgi:hypothetical protein
VDAPGSLDDVGSLDGADLDLDTDGPALDELVERLATELRATEELPVSPAASVWLGEAHAVAADLARGDVDRSVVRERVGHVRHLLENAGDVDNDEAADRVHDALRVAGAILDRTGRPDERP